MRMNETKQKEIIKCSVEKESIPKNQVDLKLLRSTFERSTSTGSRSDHRRGRTSNSTTISPGGSSIAIGEDVVDQSLPSMADALDKFRRLERSRRPGRETGRTGRSSSAEAYERVRFSEEPQVFGSNRRSLEFEDSEKQDTTPQISNLVALFSHMEGKKSSRGSANKRALEQQKSFGKSIVQQKDREPSQIGKGSEEDEETELPEEGTVQALLLQWKALETPLRKKRRSWMETQASRQADQSKDRRSWTPVASQKTMVSVQKSPSVSQKTPVAFQNTGVTSKKPSIAAQNTTWASQYSKLTSLKTQVAPNNTHAASYNTQVAPQKTQVASNYNHVASQKTQVAPHKTQVAPQKTQVAPHKTQVAPQKTQVINNKPYNRDDGDKIRATSTKDSWTTNGSLGHGKADDLHERTGKDKDQDDDQVSFDGIAKNMTEKFRELERKNAYNDEFDGSLKRKQFRWEVKPTPILGRPQGHSGGTGPVVVTFTTGTVTPPSSPEPGHWSDPRQPDVVENSIGWKSELESFPLSSQTKNLRAKFEAVPVHQHD